MWRRWAPAAALALALILAEAAQAAPVTYRLDLPQQGLEAVLIQFALQTNVSISTGDVSACGGFKGPVRGRFTLEGGLKRVLANTGCGYRLVDAHAVEIVRAAPRPPVAVRPVESAANLLELVVVATRRPTPVARLAYPVSVLDDASLDGLGVQDPADLALTTPSMTVTNLGAGRDKILLRGLSDGPLTGRTQSMVGLYLDGARITYNAPDPDLRLVDMAQVEVLRGPQGALYGAGSLGGVLRLVTAPPDRASAVAWVSASMSATQGGAPGEAVDAMMNLPFAKGRGALRLVAYREVQGGYIDDAGLGLDDVNRSIRQGARLSLGLDLTPDWTLTAGVVTQAINADDTQYALAGEKPRTRRNRLREPHDSDFAEAHLALRGDYDWGEANLSMAAVRHHLVSRYDASSSPLAPSPDPTVYDDDNNVASQVLEATVLRDPPGHIQWLAGIFYARTQERTRLGLSGPAGPAITDERRDDRLSEAALFGQVSVPLGAGFTLTAGGRAFTIDNEVTSRITGSGPGSTAAFDGRFRQSGLAPKVGLSYAAPSGAVWYLQAAEGYRVGGFNTTGAPQQAFSAPGGPEPYRNYEGDDLWSVEGGARFSLLDGRLGLRLALFEAFWRNVQSDQLLASGLPFTANIGDGRNRGVEAEATYRSGALVLRGEFLINGPELVRANPAFPGRADLGLAGVPAGSAGVSAHYDWPLGAGSTLALDARYSYVGRSRLTFDAVTAPRMGDYAVGRIAGTLSRAPWRVTVAVDNPANVAGDTFAYGNPFTLRSVEQITPLRPRTLSVTLRADF